MQLVIFFARYGLEKYPDALERLIARLFRQAPQIDWSLLVIDNALDSLEDAQRLTQTYQHHLPHAAKGRVHFLDGDNRAWEFSAWDKGRRYWHNELARADGLLLVTSAFETLYTRYLDHFTTRFFEHLGQLNWVCGHIDAYPAPIQLEGIISQHWLRSSWIFLPRQELLLQGDFAHYLPENSADWFSHDPQHPFGPLARCSLPYQRYILDWLTKPAAPVELEKDLPGHQKKTLWHSQFVLTEAQFSFFQAKARAIFNEHYLTLALYAKACPVADANWLAGQLALSKPLPAFPPPWQRQLASRQEDALLFTTPL
jgi:hypothetical protein